MCLYVDTDEERTMLDEGRRRARKAHKCHECGRTIEAGETYLFWVFVSADGMEVEKMCAHCNATIDLGCAVSGCSRAWWWSHIHDYVDDEMGFVADVLRNADHDLTFADEVRMLRRVVQYRRKWRRPNGELYPVSSGESE